MTLTEIGSTIGLRLRVEPTKKGGYAASFYDAWVRVNHTLEYAVGFGKTKEEAKTALAERLKFRQIVVNPESRNGKKRVYQMVREVIVG